MKKTLCDDALKLDATELRRQGIFSKPTDALLVCRWRRGEDVMARVLFNFKPLSASAGLLRLAYSISHAGERECEDLDYGILTVKTACHFGGVRHWFICPLIKNGRPCRRRCRILYLPSGGLYFGCRLCYDLTYESRQRHRERFYDGVARQWDKWEKAKEKLLRARKPETIRKHAARIREADMAIRQYCRKRRLA